MQLEDYKFGSIPDWSALIFVRIYAEEPYKNGDGTDCMKKIPRGFVFVIDRKFGPSAQWKLPAGHKKNGETPLGTAVRELIGETNLSPETTAFHYEGKWLGPRKDHWKCLFSVDVHERELGWMGPSHPENEGEEPQFFTAEQFYELVRSHKFMRDHFQNLKRLALILPPDCKLGADVTD